MAVEGARLYSSLERRADHFAAIYEISNAISSILDREQLLSEVVYLIQKHFGYPYVHLFTIHPDKPSELWINEVGVAPAHQGQGVGKAIMNELLRLGKQLGCANIWVLTDRSNEAANRLYKSAGGQVAEGDTVMHEFELD